MAPIVDASKCAFEVEPGHAEWEGGGGVVWGEGRGESEGEFGGGLEGQHLVGFA